MARYLKGLIPEDIPASYELAPLFTSGDSLILGDTSVLFNTVSPSGGQAQQKLSAPKIITALRFLENCGFQFDGIDLDMPKPILPKETPLEISYPDNSDLLTGLKILAIAQREFGQKRLIDEILLHCDYRVLADNDLDLVAKFKDFITPLSMPLRDFILSYMSVIPPQVLDLRRQGDIP